MQIWSSKQKAGSSRYVGSHQNKVILKCMGINEIIWECRKRRAKVKFWRFIEEEGLPQGTWEDAAGKVRRRAGKDIQKARGESGKCRSFSLLIAAESGSKMIPEKWPLSLPTWKTLVTMTGTFHGVVVWKPFMVWGMNQRWGNVDSVYIETSREGTEKCSSSWRGRCGKI